jgi:hypothetical protein
MVRIERKSSPAISPFVAQGGQPQHLDLAFSEVVRWA